MLVYSNVGCHSTLCFQRQEIDNLYQHQVEQLRQPQANSLRERAEIERFIALVQQKRELLAALTDDSDWEWQLLSTREPGFLLSNLLNHGFGQCLCNICQTSYAVSELAVYDWEGSDPEWREYQCPAGHTLHKQILRFGEFFQNVQPMRTKATLSCRCAELRYG